MDQPAGTATQDSEGFWEIRQQGKGNRADRLSDGRILSREDLEKRVRRKFEGRYLENETKGKRGNCECQGEVEDESRG